MIWLEITAWAVAVVLAVPLLVLAIECLVALKRWTPEPLPDANSRPRCAVLVPAHNEEPVLARTLLAVAPQLGADDTVLVVADNCTDGTVDIARAHGARAVERTDPVRRGKGYALAFGRDELSAAPPDVVVILDADCTLGEHALLRLVSEAVRCGRPVQASYQMTAPAEAGPNRRVAAFAFLVKNFVRPLGLRRLGGHSPLTGTGMAFPWSVFRDAPLGHGHIVEDLGLTVDLVLVGHAPVFVPEAEVRGEFPVDDRAAGSQRRRWEHGHLRVLLSGVPRLLAAAAGGRVKPLVAALDVGVPPLSALILACGAALVCLGAIAAFGITWGPAALLGGAGAGAAFALLAAWWRYGRDTLPTRALVQIPLYAFRKVPLYLGFVLKPQRDWVRTARDEPPKA